MALDIKKFLKEELKFTDAEITPELVALYTPERVELLEKGYKRQSDYSRAHDELRQKEETLAASERQLQEEMVAWGGMTAEQKAANEALGNDLKASQERVALLTQQVTDLAAKAGVDPKTLNITTPPGGPAVKLPDNIVTTDQLAAIGQQMNGLAEMSLTLPATLNMIAMEHQTLTGKPLDQRGIIAEIKKRANENARIAKTNPAGMKSLDPEQIWMETHNIQTLRDEAATKAHDAEIAAAEERGRVAARTELSVPGATPHGHARVFNRPDGTARTSVLQRPMPGQTASLAASAFASGKYRTQQTTPGGNALPAGRT